MPDPGPKQVVRRLIDEVMNRADLSVLDEVYAPRLAAAARRWIEPFLASVSDVHMRIVELIAEGETVVDHCARVSLDALDRRLLPDAGRPGHRPASVVEQG